MLPVRSCRESVQLQQLACEHLCQQSCRLICRERASGYYATYPFALAQTLIELPYLLLQTILYATIT